MRAAKFILFGILLVLVGVYLPGAIVDLVYSQSSGTSISNLLGTNSFYVYLGQIVLIGLGFLIGVIGLFVQDPLPLPPVVDLRANVPQGQGYQGYNPTPPPGFR